ncbi:extracellular matrix regulator RemB [Thalassobacillus sp. CUG 92003]|uniref:extracellular matrix regulator RemB n=1 Tax=Thalassobacillus sp. CUG 92003 TaxID=2736641 RepID=UPI0015E6888D|nr:extracellular matrix/biofilm biosynthesis regulator RemA family protein [Thalassobacillus sp. CUG 92003]
MFIHIGDDHVIQSEDVVAIIDHQLISSSSIIEEMIFNQRKNRKVIESEEEAAKAIVLTHDYIYFSPLSVYTLKKRANMRTTLNKLEDFTETGESEL